MHFDLALLNRQVEGKGRAIFLFCVIVVYVSEIAQIGDKIEIFNLTITGVKSSEISTAFILATLYQCVTLFTLWNRANAQMIFEHAREEYHGNGAIPGEESQETSNISKFMKKVLGTGEQKLTLFNAIHFWVNVAFPIFVGMCIILLYSETFISTILDFLVATLPC